MGTDRNYDIIIVGGGFFGCCLALYLRSVSDRILVIEREAELLTQASQINQARVHTGFHYPRSFVTALRSARLRERFAHDFADAVVDDFQMLYGIARRRSKVTATRFHAMFRDMQAPIAPARVSDAALFNSELVEGVFACEEFAFDWSVLRRGLSERLNRHGIDLLTGRTAHSVTEHDGRCRVILDDGSAVTGNFTFNVTYSGLNSLLLESGLLPLPLKHELAEVALVVPPAEIEGKGITLMDGPFFSTMPYPSRNLYSLTHVRYTPHFSWVDHRDQATNQPQPQPGELQSRWRHMMMDAQRYLPALADIEYCDSLVTVKTVLTKNEINDGRPILVHRHKRESEFYSVLGGKIDNIYDLFDVLPELSPKFRSANSQFVVGAP
ncbi:FAD-dependent oxidoreductase [Sphingomonas yabuuchiae]|nr:FAD-dependent oxidoreductase [Sphingomonas yabuuchiae]MBN3557008.1 FAD-binding oxidoreductase [Sphingomonas yabuuchiae]